MISTKIALIASLTAATFAVGAAHASNTDEYTLTPIIGGSTSIGTETVIYSPETYTTGSTIITQPVTTTTTGDGQFQDVDINDYLIQEPTNQ